MTWAMDAGAEANGAVEAIDNNDTDLDDEQCSPPSGSECDFFMRRPADEDGSATGSDSQSEGGRPGRGSDEGEFDFSRAFADDVLAMKNRFKVGVSEDRNIPNRRRMEDCHLTVSGLNAVNGDGLFALFDGHSGKTTAEVCRNKVCDEYLKVRHYNPKKPVPVVLNEVFSNIDQDIIKQRRDMSGCTAGVVVLVTEPKPVLRVDDTCCKRLTSETKLVRTLDAANVGDTRIVLCRDGKAIRLSRDHTCRDLNEVDRVLSTGGVVFNCRVNGTLAVTRAMGNISSKNTISGNPHTSEIELTDKDEFFIIACDGLWDVCTDQLAVDIAGRIHCPIKASEALVKYALKNGSTDNLTAIVVRLDVTYPFLHTTT